MTQKLTEWFLLSEQKPWEVGVYEIQLGLKFADGIKEVECQFQEWFAYWDGDKFSCSTGDLQSASLIRSEREALDVGAFKWRGLSANPAAPKPSGNRKVTRYVVMDLSGMDKPSAVFEKLDNALKYSEKLNWPRITKIRFRSPEAA